MTVRLALDASLRIPSCAVSSVTGVSTATGCGHPTEGFSNVIAECLEMAGLHVGEIDELVVCVGPGSYMGVRSAVATANALGLALNRGVTGILGVDSLALRAPAGIGTVAISAGRGRWYVATHRWQGLKLERLSGPYITDNLPDGAWRGSAPNSSADDQSVLDARGAVLVADQQRHLAVEMMLPEVTPHLLNASPGAP